MKTATKNQISSELSHSRTSFMVKLALMVAIIFVMAFSPLGYLRTPGLTITFLTVPVAVGAIILGPTAGAICGAAFGLTSVAMALTGGSAFSAALLQINPFGLLFTCLVPRILEGWICGLIFQLVKKFSKNGAFIVASLSCPLLNTLFFMSSLVLFFYNTEYIQGIVTKLGATNPLIFVILFVGVHTIHIPQETHLLWLICARPCSSLSIAFTPQARSHGRSLWAMASYGQTDLHFPHLMHFD